MNKYFYCWIEQKIPLCFMSGTKWTKKLSKIGTAREPQTMKCKSGRFVKLRVVLLAKITLSRDVQTQSILWYNFEHIFFCFRWVPSSGFKIAIWRNSMWISQAMFILFPLMLFFLNRRGFSHRKTFVPFDSRLTKVMAVGFPWKSSP